MAETKANQFALTHKATDQATKLVVLHEVGLTIVNPLGVNLLYNS